MISERKFKVGDRFKDWGVNRNNGIGTIVEIDNDILMVRFDEDKYTDKLLTRYNFDSELILLTPLLEALL
jgi:histidinol phosphatase-like enzyme